MIEVKAYSGLIRNYRELAEELSLDISECSREQRERKIIVAAYERWGNLMGAHINGQFGLALLDTDADELFCARDALGAELFFYYQTADGNLLYGTEIKELIGQPGFKRELNQEMIQFFLELSYVPGEETLFKGVYKLEPGGYLTFCDGELSLGKYWELSFEPDESKTIDEWADEISDALDLSFECVLDADEDPDGFLSGGVDSSYLLAKGRAKKGYCVAYEDQEASEEADARKTAEYLGRDFEGIYVSPEELFGTLDEFLVAYEQPSSDIAGLSLFCACKQVAKKSTLCFSGEGADEFFAGYGVYGNASKYEGKSNPTYCSANQAMRKFDVKHYIKNYCANRSVDEFMRQRGAAGRKHDAVSWMLFVDLRSYFEASILFNSTKISKGTGLDIRMPFLDMRIFDIARRMPSRFKVDQQGNKKALRLAASRVLPQEVAYRKKLGFPVPVRSWLADSKYNADIVRAFNSKTAEKFLNVREINALLDAFLGKRMNLWHKVRVRGNRAGLWRRVWTIYVFIRWYEIFFEEQAV